MVLIKMTFFAREVWCIADLSSHSSEVFVDPKTGHLQFSRQCRKTHAVFFKSSLEVFIQQKYVQDARNGLPT